MWQLADDIGGEVTRVRARVREHFVSLVERLRDLERACGGESVATVGRALQRRQIEQQRWRFTRGSRARSLDDRADRIGGSGVRAIAGDDFVGECLRGEARVGAVLPRRREFRAARVAEFAFY